MGLHGLLQRYLYLLYFLPTTNDNDNDNNNNNKYKWRLDGIMSSDLAIILSTHQA
jgi:hypothetical protein